MTQEGVKLVFRGEVAAGSELLRVQGELAKLLKLDPEKVKLLFDGRTTVIKSNLSRADAERYKGMFDSTGAVSLIEEPIAKATPTPTTPHPPVNPSPSGSDTAPPATPLLKAEPAPATTSIKPLVDHSNSAIPGTRSYGFYMCLVSLLGIALLSFGLYKLVDTMLFSIGSASAKGTITGYSASRSSGTRSSTTFAPEVAFRAPSGRLIRFRSHLGSNIISKKAGAQVPVKFDPADPHHAEIDGFLPLWGGPIILLLLGTAFTWGGSRMMILQRRAKQPAFGAAHLESISCPRCGFQQPQTKVCRVCRVDIPHYNVLLTKAAGYPGNLSAKQRAVFMLFVAVMVAVFWVGGLISRWHAFSSATSGGVVPYTWSDSDHHYEMTVPVDWQAQSTANVAETYPILRSEPSPMYQLVLTSKVNTATVIALGHSGIPVGRVATDGWEVIGAEVTSNQKKVFADVIQHNGLTLHRFGYDTSLGYREDAYFEAGKQVIIVRFAVPLSAGDSAAEVSRARGAVLTNLTGT